MLAGLQDANDLEEVEEDLYDVKVDRYRCEDIPAEHRAIQRGVMLRGERGVMLRGVTNLQSAGSAGAAWSLKWAPRGQGASAARSWSVRLTAVFATSNN
jgi:hypothetical protein